jgi:hypothetical protein
MGAWGTAAFDNDDASDWFYELEESGLPALEGAFDDALAADDLAGPTDVNAIAAAEVVAAALGRPAPGLRDDVAAVASSLAGKVTPDLARRARSAAERVLASSEVADLWLETDDADEWRRGVEDIIGRLAA